MAITSFGILVMALRQRDVNEDFLNSEVLAHARRVVNAIPFEQFSNSAPILKKRSFRARG